MTDLLYRPRYLEKLNQKIDFQLEDQSLFQRILLFFKT